MHQFSYLTYKQCQKHDHYLLKNGQTMPKLIEKAGNRIAEWLNKFYPNQPVLGIIGKGNNGNDILSAFHQCKNNRTFYYYLTDPSIKDHYLFKNLNKKTIPITSLKEIPNNIIIIDGIFGTGLNRPISKDIQLLIETINKLPNDIISIDIPSGLSELENNTCIKATATLTMMFPKNVFFIPEKKQQCGHIYWLNFKLTDKEKKSYFLPDTIDNYMELKI